MRGRDQILQLLLLYVFLSVLLTLATTSYGVNVTYDHRALLIDGKRRVLVSGSIHYPRSTVEVCRVCMMFCFCICI